MVVYILYQSLGGQEKPLVPHIECIKTRGKVWSKECRHHGRPLLHSHGVFFSLPLQNKPNTLQYHSLINSEKTQLVYHSHVLWFLQILIFSSSTCLEGVRTELLVYLSSSKQYMPSDSFIDGSKRSA